MTPLMGIVAGNRFPWPEWEMLEEVTLGRGRVDAVAVNLWYSRGHVIVGFEEKQSRGDWLRELRQPAKAESYFEQFDRFYLVTPPDIVQPGELPAGWGHLVVKNSRVTTVAEALKATSRPAPSRRTLAALLAASRRTHRDSREIEEIKRGAYESGYEHGEAAKEDARRRDEVLRRAEEITKAAKAFEAATGLSVWEWPYPQCHDIVRQLKQGRAFFDRIVGQWERDRETLDRMIAEAKQPKGEA